MDTEAKKVLLELQRDLAGLQQNVSNAMLGSMDTITNFQDRLNQLLQAGRTPARTASGAKRGPAPKSAAKAAVPTTDKTVTFYSGSDRTKYRGTMEAVFGGRGGNMIKYVLKKGSRLNKVAQSATSVLKQRAMMNRANVVTENADFTADLKKDYTFKSASGAACVVRGATLSGLDAWKTADGHTLREVLAARGIEIKPRGPRKKAPANGRRKGKK